MTETNDLSDRELEILQLVATGASNKEIAQQLYISTNTVKVHLRNIFTKIGVNSRTEAAMLAVQHGYVDAPQQLSVDSVSDVDSEEEISIAEQKSRIRPLVLWSVLVVVILLGFAGILIVSFNQTPQVASPNPTLSPEMPRWQTRADLPTARSGIAVVTYDGKIYVIGGDTGQEVLADNDRYDPDSDTWEKLLSKPIAVSDAGSAIIGGRIYIPGGRLSSGEMTDIMEIYNILEGTWTRGPDLPDAISAYAIVAFEGKLYLFGGWDGNQFLNTVYVYDPNRELWIEGTFMSVARSYAGATVAGGNIYVLGGINGDGVLDLSELYLPSIEDGPGNPWKQVSSMPDGRYAFGVTSLADQIYIVGGRNDGESILSSLLYMPSDDNWKIFDDSLSQPISNLGLTAVEANIYSVGGESGGKKSSLNQMYQAIFTIAIPLVR
jgi:DNA-binding CsgD family transcriptional regulator/N-acetylneuraminic acid mutarotase